MATGDAAAAAGMDLMSGSEDANTIDTEINKSRDYIAGPYMGTSAATANRWMKRDAFGRAKVAAPNATDDIARQHEVDELRGEMFTELGSIDWTTQVTGKPSSFPNADVSAATGLETPNTLVKRGSNSQIMVGDPTNSRHATNKAYVDNVADSVQSIAQDALNGELNPVVYNREITGTRRSAWVQSNGDLGYASSSIHKKQDIRPAELTLEQLRGIPVVLYRYRKAVAAERAGKIDHAATEIGTIAQSLDALGLWQFVFYEDGKPAGVHYDLLALAAISLGQQLADHLDALDERVTALENGA